MGRVKKQLKGIGVEKVIFFDSQSSGAWNQPSTESIKAKEDEVKEIKELIRKLSKKKATS